jgi:polysaccharide export outer membrane protein
MARFVKQRKRLLKVRRLKRVCQEKGGLSTRIILGLFFLALTLTGCNTNLSLQPVAPAEPQVKDIESTRQVKEMNEKLMTGGLSSKRSIQQEYKIGPDDLLEIMVFEEEKLNKTVRVSSQGNISLPLLGILKVKGLTGSQLEKEIRDLLAEKYMNDPHVSIFIKEFRNQQISLMGAVGKPGVYDFSGPKTVLDLLAVAGGLRDDAGKLLFVLRPLNPNAPKTSDAPKTNKEPDDEKPQTFVVSLEDLLIKGDQRMNLPLLHGDVVNVPPAGKVFVGGEVRSPGGFSLAKKTTLSQAITLAAGLTPKADGAVTRIFRYAGQGDQKEVITINIYSIQRGEIEDPYVKENDVVFVPKSASKTVLYEFWDLLKGRIAGFPIAW